MTGLPVLKLLVTSCHLRASNAFTESYLEQYSPPLRLTAVNAGPYFTINVRELLVPT